MNWKYFVAHVWEAERTDWEDIYLMPLVTEYQETLWLSVNGLAFIGKPEGKDEKQDQWIRNILAKLEPKGYYIDENLRGEMYVSLPTFAQAELLGYARIYLKELGFEVHELLEGTYEEFEEEINKIRGGKTGFEN
jgi:hypothetical protein